MQPKLIGGAHAFIVVIAAMIVTVGAMPAGAAETEPVVRDYEEYPLAYVPEGCETAGPDVLQNVRYARNDGPEITNLRRANLRLGDSITMRWDGFAPGCEDIGVGLSLKATNDTQFDFSENQYGTHSVYCGPLDDPCEAPFELTLALTPDGGVPCLQVDAHIGPQLSVVGPDGSYYEFRNETFNMLIGAWNGGEKPCVPEPCAVNPDLPAASIECRVAREQQAPPTTTTTMPPPTVTQPPELVTPPSTTTTTAPPPPTTAALPTTTTTAAALSAQVASRQAELPRTGASEVRDLVLAAVALGTFGSAALLFGWRRRPADVER